MHYMTHRSHRMQKYKLVVTSQGAAFVESIPVPPEHEKECDHILCPGHTRMHYVTCRSYQMQKHKFGIICPNVLFIETAPGPP
jgi:hypothetical protein